MKHLKKFNEGIGWLDFKGDEPYIKFDSTYQGDNNSSNWRDNHKKIKPSDYLINEVTDKIKSEFKSNDQLTVKWYENFRQLYCIMYDNTKQYTYGENGKLNKKGFIIDFYEDDWIFVSTIQENHSHIPETHYVCDGLDGLYQWIKDKKKYILTK